MWFFKSFQGKLVSLILSKDLYRTIGSTIKIVKDASQGEIISLEGVGYEVWKFLEKKPQRFEEIIDFLHQEFEVDKKTLEKDITQFLISLQKHHLIKVE